MGYREGVERRRIIKGRTRQDHTRKPKRPTVCAWQECQQPIAAASPIWYDRQHAILEEVELVDGTIEIMKSVGGFCSPDCMYHRRELLLAPARERSRNKPSP